MQVQTKNPLSPKFQNQEPFANGLNSVGGGVTSALYDNKKALKLINDMRFFDYSTSYALLIIEDIEKFLEDGDTTLLINSLKELETEKNHFLSFKRKLKKLGYELVKHEQISARCCTVGFDDKNLTCCVA